QSAAVIAAHEAQTPEGLAADHLDLRADDHVEPADELLRLLDLQRGR
ncbi:MAG: fimbrial assembly protein FimA, partial [Microbacteriaceae bacterium]|nr:fimbrial assembly protein FimA [Microbacteriaceae bacterium]